MNASAKLGFELIYKAYRQKLPFAVRRALCVVGAHGNQWESHGIGYLALQGEWCNDCGHVHRATPGFKPFSGAGRTVRFKGAPPERTARAGRGW